MSKREFDVTVPPGRHFVAGVDFVSLHAMHSSETSPNPSIVAATTDLAQGGSPVFSIEFESPQALYWFMRALAALSSSFQQGEPQ